MIVGVDHIAMSCTDLRKTAHTLEEYGLACVFLADDEPNVAGKAPLLRVYQRRHGVAYFAAPAAVAIELTAHGPQLGPQQIGSPRPLLGGPLVGEAVPTRECEVQVSALRATLGVKEPVLRRWHPGATFWQDAAVSTSDLGVRALLVPTNSLDGSIKFWSEALRARLVRNEREWAHLKFIAPIQKWCLDIVLTATSKCSLSYLDDAGFPVIALISTDLDQDSERIVRSGAKVSTGISGLNLNERFVLFQIFRGASGELVELLQIKPLP